MQPPRAHHCCFCDSCILKRDHHCPWINNCIGFNNYKCFITLIFWMCVTCLFVICTYWMPFYNAAANPHSSLMKCYLITLEYLIAISLFIALLYFLAFHIWLILKGMTTAEYNTLYKCEANHPKSDYDISCMENFKQVFGNNMLEWLIPFSTYINRSSLQWRVLFQEMVRRISN